MPQPSPAPSEGAAARWAAPSVAHLTLATMILVFSFVQHRLVYTLTPQATNISPDGFSEARARQHLMVLAEQIADRQVSMPGLAKATAYMMLELQALKDLAANRTDVTVQVERTTVSGAVGMTFTRINFTNAYRALDNVALVITPTGTAHLKGLLISSHYDSPVSSQGAADDASQVSVMLEVARTLLSRTTLPHTPVTFLWTGGEEPISPAAHGWSTTSPLYPQQGAFINLEAMGGGGLPIIFQHSGSWVLQAYAAGCPLPRGSRVAQDIFDLHIMPADSDYRMFSARHYGSLPGLDIAFIVDCTAYHSYLDTPNRVRPGVMQEMGESLLGGLMSVSSALAARQQPGVQLSGQEEVAAAQQRSVYFDILGYTMVSYSDDLAHKLHHLPLLLLLTLPITLPAASARRVSTRALYFNVWLAGGRTLISMLLALALPMLLGAVRTLASGRPMVWFAQHWVGHLQTLPIAAAGALLPWVTIGPRAHRSPIGVGQFMSCQMQGVGITVSLLGSLLTQVGLTGNAMIFVMTGCVALLASYIVARDRLTLGHALLLLSSCVLVMTIGCTIVCVFLSVIMERMAISGHIHLLLADLVVGALSGAGVLAMSCGVLMPVLGYTIPPRRGRQLVALLTVASIAGAAWSAAYIPAYQPHAPKRSAVSHLIQTTLAEPGSGTGPEGGVAMQVTSEAMLWGAMDSTPLQQVVNMSAFTLVPPVGREFSPIYPLDILLQGFTAQLPATNLPLADRQTRYASPAQYGTSKGAAQLAPGLAEVTHPDTLVTHLPFVQLLGVEDVQDAGGRQLKRVQLRLFSEVPCWGILNVTARGLTAWSFTPALSPSSVCKECQTDQHVVRFTTQDTDPYWPFWLEVKTPSGSSTAGLTVDPGVTTPTSKLQDTVVDPDVQLPKEALGVRIEVHVSYLPRTPALRRGLALLPDFTAETWLATSYQSYWEL